MNDFNSWYLALLRKQVEEEIQFLKTNGHDVQFVHEPCMFCVQHREGLYTCRRLKDLREFHSSIMSNVRSRSKRRTIGYEPVEDKSVQIGSDLPFTSEPIFEMK